MELSKADIHISQAWQNRLCHVPEVKLIEANSMVWLILIKFSIRYNYVSFALKRFFVCGEEQ